MCFFDKRMRVISDEFLEFLLMGLFKIEGCGSSVGVADGTSWRVMSMERWWSPGLEGYAIYM